MTTTDDEDFGQLYRRGRPVDISVDPAPPKPVRYLTFWEVVGVSMAVGTGCAWLFILGFMVNAS